MNYTITAPFAASDLCIFRFMNGELYVYLVKLKYSFYKGLWALPGGLVKEKEDLETACKRIYKEATGRKNAYFEQLHTFSDPKRDPRTRSISTSYIALPQGEIVSFSPCSKYQTGEWKKVKEIKTLAYDHLKILNNALEDIATKLNYSTIGLSLLPKKFTFKDLQDLYEYCLKIKIDKRNFRKKIISLNIIKKSGEMLTGIKARPAMLFTSKEPGIKAIPMFN